MSAHCMHRCHNQVCEYCKHPSFAFSQPRLVPAMFPHPLIPATFPTYNHPQACSYIQSSPDYFSRPIFPRLFPMPSHPQASSHVHISRLFPMSNLPQNISHAQSSPGKFPWCTFPDYFPRPIIPSRISVELGCNCTSNLSILFEFLLQNRSGMGPGVEWENNEQNLPIYASATATLPKLESQRRGSALLRGDTMAICTDDG